MAYKTKETQAYRDTVDGLSDGYLNQEKRARGIPPTRRELQGLGAELPNLDAFAGLPSGVGDHRSRLPEGLEPDHGKFAQTPKPGRPMEAPDEAPAKKSKSGSSNLLAKGAKGGRVMQVQRILQDLAYGTPGDGGALSPLEADGDYGKNTENAVRAFQEANGLTVDGIVGEETLFAMIAKLNDSAQQQGRDVNPETNPRVLGPNEEYDGVIRRPVVRRETEVSETVKA
jgi:hypothetical protein